MNDMRRNIAVKAVLSSAFIVLLAYSALAQRNMNVLDWNSDAMLNNYLVAQMNAQYDSRHSRVEQALKSANAMRAYIADCQKRISEVFGQMPKRTPLNAQITGTLHANGYSIEKLLYESSPQHHVTANLYIPSGKGPFPAALLFCGHEETAKATPSYEQTAVLFAKNGYVVLVIDPISQSERYQLLDDKGKALTRGGTSEHTLLNEAANLLGASTPADELWDNIRGLDYLVTRPEVDTTRIGCLGNSGGGMQTIYFAGMDRRIKVMAPCSYLATRQRTLELTGPADGCAQMPGEGALQLEFNDYLFASAPKPVLVLAGRYDFIDYRGTQDAFSELKKVYTALGHSEKAAMFTYDDGHGISKPKREAAVQWFNRWLKNDPAPVHEDSGKLFSASELQVTTTGQLQSAIPQERNLVTRNLAQFENLGAARFNFSTQPVAVIRSKVASLAGVNVTKRNVQVENKGTFTESRMVYTREILRKDGEPPLPILIAYPSGDPVKIMIWCTDEGKSKLVNNDTVLTLLSQQNLVILCDVRGTGETADKAIYNDPKYYNREYRNAMLALHNGRSLVGQRATDILTLIDRIKSTGSLAGLPVTLKASGIVTLPALHAALMEPSIQNLDLSGGIRSWKEVLDHPAYRDWYSYVIPGALQFYDLPDLVKWLSPRIVNHSN